MLFYRIIRKRITKDFRKILNKKFKLFERVIKKRLVKNKIKIKKITILMNYFILEWIHNY